MYAENSKKNVSFCFVVPAPLSEAGTLWLRTGRVNFGRTDGALSLRVRNACWQELAVRSKHVFLYILLFYVGLGSIYL